ncbi:hypothetical protein QUA46_16820, partial [Microcoleus sp. MON2_D6]|uniref:hypothetical protein n=1 Tax=Microcoleus sp. MON2_D6 TaxID=3055377 RepID=UPI002FD126F8
CLFTGAFTEKKSIRLWNRHLACSPAHSLRKNQSGCGTGILPVHRRSRRHKQILWQHKQDACSGQLMFKMHPYCYLMVEAKRVKK